MKKIWQYLFNQFLNATRDNYKKAVQLSDYHDADLQKKQLTEPLLVPIYARYHPLHLILVDEYAKWKTAGGSQEGQTLNVGQMLDLACGQLPQWELTVQILGPQFMKGTPNFKSIFPNGRKSFTSGSIKDRIEAFDSLAKNLQPFSGLSSLMAIVSTTYINLDAARHDQEGAKGTVKADSGNVELARVAAMTMQWRNLGFAMDNFWDKPNYIESLFDLPTLRSGSQREFTGRLDPLEIEAVLKHTFHSDDELLLKNVGDADITFYLSNTPHGAQGIGITVAANTEMHISVNQFDVPDYSTYRFLTAINQSKNTITKYVVELL
jgi:hypothetical protein